MTTNIGWYNDKAESAHNIPITVYLACLKSSSVWLDLEGKTL